MPSGSGGLAFPFGLTFGPDGNLYVGNVANQSIMRFNGTTGAFIDTFVPAGSGGLFGLGGLTFGPDKNLYIGSFATSNVLRYNGTTGAFMDAFVPSGSAGLTNPLGLTFGPDGDLYVSSHASNSILRYNGTTGAFIDTFVSPGTGGLAFPARIAFGPDHDLYVQNYLGQVAVTGEFISGLQASNILHYNGTTGAFVNLVVPADSNGVDNIGGLAFTSSTSVPEPASTVGLLMLGVWGMVSQVKHKLKK